mgnify:CR=1 FL=1
MISSAMARSVFESLVSFEGCKTGIVELSTGNSFESLVSFEGCKTKTWSDVHRFLFESLVSFEGCKTKLKLSDKEIGLRVL